MTVLLCIIRINDEVIYLRQHVMVIQNHFLNEYPLSNYILDEYQLSNYILDEYQLSNYILDERYM